VSFLLKNTKKLFNFLLSIGLEFTKYDLNDKNEKNIFFFFFSIVLRRKKLFGISVSKIYIAHLNEKIVIWRGFESLNWNLAGTYLP